jgi:hypothetical protein
MGVPRMSVFVMSAAHSTVRCCGSVAGAFGWECGVMVRAPASLTCSYQAPYPLPFNHSRIPFGMSRKTGTTSLSNGTLSCVFSLQYNSPTKIGQFYRLRFMQRGATQRVSTTAAKVTDESEWDIGPAARAALGVVSGPGSTGQSPPYV